MSTRAMTVPIFTFLVLISSTAKGSLQFTNQEYPLMYFTKLLSEEIFTPGLPLVVMLPVWEEISIHKEVGYLIQELHTSSRWPILVHNMSYSMEGYTRMHKQTHPHGSYIILISGSCRDWGIHTLTFIAQLQELTSFRDSWNPKAKFIVSLMSNCTYRELTKYSRYFLRELWFKEVVNAVVLFLKSKEHRDINMQGNTTDSAQGTYFELHTCYPYENSERCNPLESSVPVKVFTVRHLKDIRRSDIFRGYNDKNFHKCPIKVFVKTLPPLVYPPKQVRYNDSYNQAVYEKGLEIEMMKLIGNALNMSLDFMEFGKRNLEGVLGHPVILVGCFRAIYAEIDNIIEYTQSYFTICLSWYTPCAVKYERLSRFFNIFSVDMWMCFTLSLALAVITVRCISNYRHKPHLHESKSYSNIFIVTANIISVVLSVSVNTQPRSAPLRLFFFCWVCYSVAISTVFQAYLTTFLIEPGYEEPIKTVEQMLNSEKNFGFRDKFKILFPDTSDPVDSAIVKNAVECPDEPTCFTWAAEYHNITTILSDLYMANPYGEKKFTDENNRPLLCELESGVVRRMDFAILFGKRSPFFELINDVLNHIIEVGIDMQIMKPGLEKVQIQTEFNSHSSDDTYFVFGVSHLQTAFYLLMLGYFFGSCLFCG